MKINGRWSVLISVVAFVLLVVVSFYPAADALDLSVSENTYDMTPAAAIQTEDYMDVMLVPTALDGNAGVEQIQTLEYIPPPDDEPEASVEEAPAPETQPSKQVSEPPAQPEQAVPALSPPTKQYTVMHSRPTFAVFPVLTHTTKSKAFADLPLVVATAVSNQLNLAIDKGQHRASVMNPVYTPEELRKKGLEGVYQQVMADYLRAGEPSEYHLTFLTDRLSNNTQHIDWVVFVQADMDLTNWVAPKGYEIPLNKLWGVNPEDGKYKITAHVKVFSTQTGIPLVLEKTDSYTIHYNDFRSFTGSVYDDSATIKHFQKAAKKMAGSFVGSLPRHIYDAQTDVKATLVEVKATPEEVQKGTSAVIEASE